MQKTLKSYFPYVCKQCGDATGYDKKICYRCDEIRKLNMGGLTKVDVYGHDFGLLIPSESGYLWENQTDGVCCHHIQVEGIYIPLENPCVWDENKNKRVNLLENLTEANYDGKPTKRIWDRINKELPFKYKEVEPPERKVNPYPCSTEGIQWIEITSCDKGYRGSTWRQFMGQKIALIYPNCD